ncbi:MAG TPA: ferredoxin [Nocardioides sp.]|nr:ferredoxin [Nocardioides sp.]
MSVRPDNRLADVPMTPLACHTCGARVEVRKSSWDQTSIQWLGDSIDACVERRATTPGMGPNAGAFQGCSALRDTVREAAVSGELRIVDEDPLKVNPEADAH